MPTAATSWRALRGWHLVLAVPLLVHLAIGLYRVPGVVFARRWDDVAAYRARGAAAWFLDKPQRRGAAVVEWIVANVPPDRVVLFAGETNGSLELVPCLIAPRLLVKAADCAAGAVEYRGRPLATRTGAGDRERVVVLVGTGDDLRLEERER